MNRKSPSFGERAGNSLLQKEFTTYPDTMQAPATLFDRLRHAYAALAAAPDDDFRRVAFHKARLAYRRSFQQGEAYD